MSYAVSEISARSPDMGVDEFTEFVADIKKNGQLVPIWVRGAEVIDGRKRLAACTQLGIKPLIVNLDPSQDAERVARALNVLRTHYSRSQLALYAAERANLPRGNPEQIRKNAHLAEPISQRQAAKEVGVSHRYVSKAREVIETAAPEVVEAVRSGDLTIHAAGRIAEEVSKPDQPAAVARVVEASKDKPLHSPARVLGGEDVRKHRALPKKPEEQFARSVQMIEVAVDVCMTNVPHVGKSFNRNRWLQVLAESRTTITHIIKALEN